MKIIILLGIHGSGKGEQMKRLLERGIVQDAISTGEAFRSLSNPDSRYHPYEAVAAPFLHLYAQGKYFPDSVALEIVKGEVEKDKEKKIKVIGMEGFPRTLPQAQSLVEMVNKIGGTEMQFIYLDLPDEVALARLKNRSLYDKRDTDAVDTKRIALYHEVTDPMILYLRGLGLVKDVDDRPGIEEVHSLIVKAIG